MIYKSENRVLTVNGKAIEGKVNTISFEVSGTQFPQYTSLISYDTQYVRFTSNVAQSVEVNYGDGTLQTYLMKYYNGKYVINFSHQNQYLGGNPDSYYPLTIYADGNSGIRTITFRFDFLREIDAINWTYVNMEGVVPTEIGYADKLSSIILNATMNLQGLPLQILENKNLKTVNLSSAFKNKLTKIPDELFELDLINFTAGDIFDLSDPITSNLFKLVQWKNTLTVLDLNYSKISAMPEELGEMTLIETLRLRENPLTNFPVGLSNLTRLYEIQIGSYDTPFENTSWGNFDFKRLTILAMRVRNMDLSNLENDWKYLFSLRTISVFKSFVDSNARFNEFIDSLYKLCTNEGSILDNGSPAPYPNRFRNMNWGDETLAFTGAKVAPPGYVQGVSNGTPTTNGQKVYVLQNQYNHTITHA